MRVIEILATQPTLNERIGLVTGISSFSFDRDKVIFYLEWIRTTLASQTICTKDWSTMTDKKIFGIMLFALQVIHSQSHQ